MSEHEVLYHLGKLYSIDKKLGGNAESECKAIEKNEFNTIKDMII